MKIIKVNITNVGYGKELFKDFIMVFLRNYIFIEDRFKNHPLMAVGWQEYHHKLVKGMIKHAIEQRKCSR